MDKIKLRRQKLERTNRGLTRLQKKRLQTIQEPIREALTGNPKNFQLKERWTGECLSITESDPIKALRVGHYLYFTSNLHLAQQSYADWGGVSRATAFLAAKVIDRLRRKDRVPMYVHWAKDNQCELRHSEVGTSLMVPRELDFIQFTINLVARQHGIEYYLERLLLTTNTPFVGYRDKKMGYYGPVTVPRHMSAKKILAEYGSQVPSVQ